jgi:hypothetical protein
MFKKTIVISIATLCVAFLGWPHLIQALTLTPTSREISLTPGEKVVSTITLTNETTKAIELTTEVVGFTAKDESGKPKFNFSAPLTDMATWIVVDKGPIKLASQETKAVDVVFSVPADAVPGGHYAAVFFNEAITGQAAGQVNVESKLGTLFLATVKGSYTESGQVITFNTTDGKTVFGNGPMSFVVRFSNTGEVHLKPAGNVTITNMFGKTIKVIPVNSDANAVLPSSIREFTATWDDVGNGYGQYKATLTLTSGSAADTAVFTFWVMPSIWLLLICIAIIIAAAILLLLIMGGAKKTATLPPAQKNP